MAEQAQGISPLSAVVADVAQGVALALRGGGGSYALSDVLPPDEAVAPAAVRVLGADALAPYALDRAAATGGATDRTTADRALVRAALTAFAPGADASEVSLWSYRGLLAAARALLPADPDGWPPEPPAATAWTATDPWPKLAHRASQLASLALPGLDTPLAAGLAERTDDLARGFVRAVRRRDWLQAAGLGRWLASAADVPDTLGLDSGLVFVRQMSGTQPRVALHVAAAARFYGRGS
ncbi:hypothetical protein SAMN05216251_12019 [Actinacidiphila alni]|uniref:Uncharacterized protein n=1 Tax=Actinacidiphila alni TaxID=380248 RepID=A0A1I2JZ79_9ACTN|nr:hypothetical protein [Actinacidiphila alni]SFF58247.1 hypothetical protein SAMN05216251_12019 [Actinacidiphila alni]